MYDALRRRVARLAEADCGAVIRSGLKGIERESLRTTPEGALAATPHPSRLGSALTHPSLTTDYAEPLLEFVTLPFASRRDTMGYLRDLHRFVARNIGDEILWAASMPCAIAGDDAIPIARYGTSNSGRLRHVYRIGLAHRYGRMMQVIAGVHFNYSVAGELWPILTDLETLPSGSGSLVWPDRTRIDPFYFKLIRNLLRYGWLLLYLFGASPALARSFLPDGAEGLAAFDDSTWHGPYATSLRMSDIGYTNRIPGGIGISYDDLYAYAASLYRAITTPHPQWEGLGIRRGDEYVQLNSNLLQMENEYYSSVRPKQPARRGERPTTALQRRGVRYVELRSIDIDPFSSVGITADRLLFLEVFMVFCLLHESPTLAPDERRSIDENQSRVAVRGRQPDLKLRRGLAETSLKAWGLEILDEMTAVAELFQAPGHDAIGAVNAQRAAVEEPDASPSARVLREMRESGHSFVEYGLGLSRGHSRALRTETLDEERRLRFEREAAESLAAQAALEAGDRMTFEEYLAAFFA